MPALVGSSVSLFTRKTSLERAAPGGLVRLEGKRVKLGLALPAVTSTRQRVSVGLLTGSF